MIALISELHREETLPRKENMMTVAGRAILRSIGMGNTDSREREINFFDFAKR
jgi:hypothetical protein